MDFYSPVPDKPLPNDDLDLQLVWLKMIEDNGYADPELGEFAEYWKKYLKTYPWDEYGFCLRNLFRGLKPPISGVFENNCIDNMGSPIRSEIWACIAPGDPQLAASFALKDAILDHAGGEGIYGELFWSAVQSAAFVISDPLELIRIGLTMIPLSSGISRVINQVLWMHDNNISWAEARDKIARAFSNPSKEYWGGIAGYSHPCCAVPNHGFTVLGWLYGKDFGDRLCKAVNCGYDTDCTGATLGAVLGILNGLKGIPEKWIKPIGKKIILHQYTGQFNAPGDIEELTSRTVKAGKAFLEKYSETVSLGSKKIMPGDIISLLNKTGYLKKVIGSYDMQSMEATTNGLRIVLHFSGQPDLYPGVEKEIRVSVWDRYRNILPDKIELKGNRIINIKKQDNIYLLKANKPSPHNTVKVNVKYNTGDYKADFIFLDPGEAKGWPIGHTVETCPKCQGRIESCVCKRKNSKSEKKA